VPELGKLIPPSQGRQRVEATNKIQLTNGWYQGRIVDVWIYSVDENGKYTKQDTGEKKVSIKVSLLAAGGVDSGIVLDWRRRAYLSKQSHFALALASLTGLQPGSDEMRRFDSDKLIGMAVEVQTQQADEYVNITAFKPGMPLNRPPMPAVQPNAVPSSARAPRAAAPAAASRQQYAPPQSATSGYDDGGGHYDNPDEDDEYWRSLEDAR
jgi:hypothetical protein